MRYIILILSTLCAIFTTHSKTLSFSETTWNFGTIAEEGGLVTHTFEIKNRASEPFVIYTVNTSCGCTTSKYTRKPIAAGETTTLEINFDPKYRPGHFSKEIFLYTSATKEPVVLKITGDVTPRVLALEERYPYNIGADMRIGSLHTSFRAVPHGRLVQQSVEFKNTSTSSQNIEFKKRDNTSALQLYYDGHIKAHEGRSIEIGYYIDSGRGELRDTVDIYINGIKSPKSLYIKGLIVE